MNKLSKEKQQQIMLVVMVAAAVLGCLYYFVIRSQGAGIEEKRKKRDEATADADNAQKDVNNASKFKADREAIEKKLGAIEEKMLSGRDVYGPMVLRINQFVRERDHRITVPISREEQVKLGLFPEFPYDALSFKVSGQGFYHDIGKFIADFENTFPYMRVQNIEMTPAEAAVSDTPEKLAYKLEIIALQKGEPKTETK